MIAESALSPLKRQRPERKDGQSAGGWHPNLLRTYQPKFSPPHTSRELHTATQRLVIWRAVVIGEEKHPPPQPEVMQKPDAGDRTQNADNHGVGHWRLILPFTRL